MKRALWVVATSLAIIAISMFLPATPEFGFIKKFLPTFALLLALGGIIIAKKKDRKDAQSRDS